MIGKLSMRHMYSGKVPFSLQHDVFLAPFAFASAFKSSVISLNTSELCEVVGPRKPGVEILVIS